MQKCAICKTHLVGSEIPFFRFEGPIDPRTIRAKTVLVCLRHFNNSFNGALKQLEAGDLKFDAGGLIVE